MRLKRLTLHGFKTFADRTEISFADGVTSIVGPNGSGKSNVVDSILWVLGEQKASSLRATKASDVIFAGSSRRKPMGMAEVSLTVDNEDRFLPLDFSEVTVTRRIYRSGEGEYLLNKVPCRLKDITELFLDTGVGRGAYAIVNQSEIDAILSARPEDRRELFEEAAGIKKYRQKKREAQRKLEHTEQNLLRIRDISSELEGSLAPLEAQAITARRFKELSERLREIEVGLLAADYKRLQDEQTRAKPSRCAPKPPRWKNPPENLVNGSSRPKRRWTGRVSFSKRRWRKASASRGVSRWARSVGQARSARRRPWTPTCKP
jgi:chromosome segregation protein